MNTARKIIAKFGTQAKIAEAIGKSESAAYYWAKVGTIPSRWHGPLLQAARDRGIDLSPEDFAPLLDANTSSKQNPSGQEVSHPRVPVAKWYGTVFLGDLEMPSYVLDDGRRVLSRRNVVEALTNNSGGGNLEGYLSVNGLKGYLPASLYEDIIEFKINDVEFKTVKGMSAETFLEICKAYVRALGDKALETDRQREIAIQSAIFLSACAKIGLIALIDEATGYQYARPADALHIKLKIFLEEEMRKWEKTFPDELWFEFARLTNWQVGVPHPGIRHRPKYWGKLVIELVYDYLDKDVSDWLKGNAPKPRHGQNYHQWLSDQYGLKKLTEHIWMLIGMSRACYTMRELKEKMAERFGRQPVQYTLYLEPPHNYSNSRSSSKNVTQGSAENAGGDKQLRL